MNTTETKSKLAEITQSEVAKLGLKLPFAVRVRHFSEIHPRAENQDNTYCVQVTISDDKKELREHSPVASHLDFWYKPLEKTIAHAKLFLADEVRGSSLAKSLHDIMKYTATQMGCESVKLDSVVNPKLHLVLPRLGYARTGEDCIGGTNWELRLA